MIPRMHQVQNAARVAMGDYRLASDPGGRRRPKGPPSRLVAGLTAIALFAAGLLLAY